MTDFLKKWGATMAEYKDVEPLKKHIADFKQIVNSPNSDYLTGYISALSATEGIIAGLPNADIEPVKHGHWKHIAGMNSKCSECDRYFPVSEFDKRPFDINYCPNCGTKMDGKEVQK